MVLLYVLSQLQKKYGWQLSVAHVNYGLRGKESAADMALVQETAKIFGLPFYSLTKKALAKKSEEALRDIRYAFFERLVQKHHFDIVVLAHHQDDQAETVLMRLIRGSGSTGLSGMRPQRGVYVRPFLTFAKAELLAFAQAAHIPYRLDKSNQENVYLRNKVRNELIPLLETYNPNIKKTLAAMATTFQTEDTTPPPAVTFRTNPFSFSLAAWQKQSKSEQVARLRTIFQERGLSVPTKNLTQNLVNDLASTRKKGSTKDYSRLRLSINDGMIDIHFKELD